MKTIFHKASERGHADHGWLNAYHSFSFAGYHDPSRVHFGLLRVLNDDTVAPGMGFGMHPHDNMEIVTIPLKGSLEHKDSMGNIGVIGPNEIQAMSAGSGVRHSEYNHSATDPVNLLQIWVFPKVRNIEPRYDQKKYSLDDTAGIFKTIVSPDKADDVMWINQDAYFSLGKFKAGQAVEYKIQHPGNGAYVFIIEGGASVDSESLSRRDALGIWDVDQFEISINTDAEILVIDVPMN
ncbi:MAG TPA: pirin family protein [Chitinophagaceae bacterium]|nr:pirin family protein [Chitinophagaceae bacterium]